MIKHSAASGGSLARALHALPRFDGSLEAAPTSPPTPIRNLHDPAVQHYLQGLLSLLLIPLLAFGTFLLIDIGTRCLRCWKRCGRGTLLYAGARGVDEEVERRRGERSAARKSVLCVALGILFVCGAGMLAWGVPSATSSDRSGYRSYDVRSGTASLAHSVRELTQYFDSVHTQVRDVLGIRTGIRLIDYIIADGLIPSSRPDLLHRVEEAKAELVEGDRQVSHYLNLMESLDLAQLGSATDTFQSISYRFSWISTMLCVLGVCVALFAWYLVHRHLRQSRADREGYGDDDAWDEPCGRKARSCICKLLVDIVEMVCATTLMLMACGLLVASTATADVCTDPTHFAVGQVSVWGVAVQDTAQYYILCNGTMRNPLEQTLDAALLQVNSSFSVLEELQEYAQGSGDAQLLQLVDYTFANMTEAEDALLHVRSMLDCQGPHEVLAHGEEALCRPWLYGLFLLSLCSLAVVLCMLAARCYLDCPCKCANRYVPCCCSGVRAGRRPSSPARRSQRSRSPSGRERSESEYKEERPDRHPQHDRRESFVEASEFSSVGASPLLHSYQHQYYQSSYYPATGTGSSSSGRGSGVGAARPIRAHAASSSSQRYEEDREDDDAPPSYVCPISGDVMRDPVIAKSGYTFERSAIVQWLQRNPTCPLTRQPLRLGELIDNRALKDDIERWRAQTQQHHPRAVDHAAAAAAAAAAGGDSDDDSKQPEEENDHEAVPLVRSAGKEASAPLKTPPEL